MTAPYVICFTNGCMADYEASARIDRQAEERAGPRHPGDQWRPASRSACVLPLADFGKAYDGPPTDPKVFEEQQKKLQDELQRRAEEARKKLEGQQAALDTVRMPSFRKTVSTVGSYWRKRASRAFRSMS